VSNVVIIGGGHNGLVAAYYLAKAGMRPQVLEARHHIGGGAITTEIHPGFRCPTLTHETPVWADVVRDMDLSRHGLRFLTPGVELWAPDRDGRALVIHRDAQQTAASIGKISARDAVAYASYRAAIERVSSVLASVFTSPPPDIDNPTGRDLWNLLTAGRAFRRLGRKDGYRLLRWGPMPVSDLMGEWFESDLLRAALAGPAVSGTMLGPRSAGSSLVLLMREAHARLAQDARPARGGPGAVTAAMEAAARAAGAEIHTGTPVERIVVRDEHVAAVVAGGREIPATAVVSAVDPKTTLLTLVDPADLTPDFISKVRNYRAAGTIAKVNLALSALPEFGPAQAGYHVPPEHLSGRIHIGPDLDYLERAFDHAKYGEMSAEPWLDITIPTVLEPELAPPGAHVMSIYVHYAPYRLREGDWDARKTTLAERVLTVLERYAPGIRALVVAAQTITPAELERDYGFFGGHPFHGELALDQLYTMRPILGYGRYATPIRGLHLCGAGTHPGGFMTGGSGRLAAREIVR
jgi:phytoene dehydrogenase-like protein